MDFDWHYSPLIGQLRLLLDGRAHPSWTAIAWLATIFLVGLVVCGWSQWRLAGADQGDQDLGGGPSPYNGLPMALPKTRYAHARQGERRAHLAIKRVQLVECSQCHQPKRPHAICRNCGYYDGREVIKTD